MACWTKEQVEVRFPKRRLTKEKKRENPLCSFWASGRE